MPRGDRTGPEGTGPVTGRKMGFCAGYDEPGFTAGGRGRGFRRKRGAGGVFGYGNRFGRNSVADYSGVSEKTLIENEIRIMKDQMTALEKRLSEVKDK